MDQNKKTKIAHKNWSIFFILFLAIGGGLGIPLGWVAVDDYQKTFGVDFHVGWLWISLIITIPFIAIIGYALFDRSRTTFLSHWDFWCILPKYPKKDFDEMIPGDSDPAAKQPDRDMREHRWHGVKVDDKPKIDRGNVTELVKEGFGANATIETALGPGYSKHLDKLAGNANGKREVPYIDASTGAHGTVTLSDTVAKKHYEDHLDDENPNGKWYVPGKSSEALQKLNPMELADLKKQRDDEAAELEKEKAELKKIGWQFYPVELLTPLAWRINNVGKKGRVEYYERTEIDVALPASPALAIDLHDMKIPYGGFDINHSHAASVVLSYMGMNQSEEDPRPMYKAAYVDWFDDDDRTNRDMDAEARFQGTADVLNHAFTRLKVKTKGDSLQLQGNKAEADEAKNVRKGSTMKSIANGDFIPREQQKVRTNLVTSPRKRDIHVYWFSTILAWGLVVFLICVVLRLMKVF